MGIYFLHCRHIFNRRLSHALCPSPLNDPSLLILSKLCGELSQSIEFWKNCSSGSSLLEMKVDDVKEAASYLISSVPVSSESAFLAAHLYYDLCERMLSYGRLSEALSFAKEAQCLRSKLLQENFRYSTNQQAEIHDETAEAVRTRRYTFSYFQVRSSVAIAARSQDKELMNLEGTVLTPCGARFKLTTSIYTLGRLYRKQHLWDQALDELRSAELILKDPGTANLCLKCRLLLEATVDLEMGDLFRSRRDNLKNLSNAQVRYKIALDKLKLPEWKISFESLLNRQSLIEKQNQIMTRSKYRSQVNKADALCEEVQVGLMEDANSVQRLAFASIIEQKVTKLEISSSLTGIGKEISCFCNKKKCWPILLKLCDLGL